MYGKLFLITSPLLNCNLDEILPINVKKIINKLNYFIVENKKNANSFIKKICPKKILFNVLEISKNNLNNNVDYYLNPIFKGHSIGLLSDSGMPCIADPGSEIVLNAHKKNLTIVPLVGPSSILMSLMSSGLNGQKFVFHGYLPIIKKKLIKKIKLIENNSKKYNQTQIFIETPYRNNRLLEIILSICNKKSLLTISTEITGKNEIIKTKSISEWRKNKIEINKKPSLFCLILI